MSSYRLAFEKWKFEKESGFYEGKPEWEMVTKNLTESEAQRRFDKMDVDAMWKRDMPEGMCYVATIQDDEGRLCAVKLYNQSVWEEENGECR